MPIAGDFMDSIREQAEEAMRRSGLRYVRLRHRLGDATGLENIYQVDSLRLNFIKEGNEVLVLVAPSERLCWIVDTRLAECLGWPAIRFSPSGGLGLLETFGLLRRSRGSGDLDKSLGPRVERLARHWSSLVTALSNGEVECTMRRIGAEALWASSADSAHEASDYQPE